MLHAQSSFIVGTNAVPVVFEDAELSQTNRVLICNDLTRVFAFESNFTNLITYFNNPAGDDVGYLKSVGVNVYPFKVLLGVKKVEGQYSLDIHEDISQRYIKCFSDMASQTNLLQQADAFLAMLNAGEAVNLTPKQKSKLIWLPEDEEPGTPDEYAEFARSTVDLKFYPPSILSAEWLEKSRYPGKPLVVTVVVAPKNALSEVFDVGLIHDGTQWRFMLLY